MKKEDNLETNVIQYEKSYKQKTYCRLMKKQQKNGISPWKNTGKIKKGLQSNESSQQSLEEKNETASPFSCRETSKPPSLSTEDSAEDFNIELTIFNDLMASSDLIPCNEYIPYYRTYANLVENPLQINTELNHENIEREDIQSNGCVFKLKHEDEPLNDMDLTNGYFPYYRTYEEYFDSSDLSTEVHSRTESEEGETNEEEIESKIDCEIEEVYEDTVTQENWETNEDTSQYLESLKYTETQILTDSIIEFCDSEMSLFDEILSLNQSPSASGYFPYYRTYGKLFLSPVASSNVFYSSGDALEVFGMANEGTLEGTRDYSNGCSVC
ncbi:uncharacterized protein LOC133382242 isoform X1 [Rhineura floridana]|uniref:uncharacterized protein LOC133382242 isoform X1 n=1 Tax=Rhineura floridana TaxID=261503 RepID=UPI002AC84D60|nr:uncharacterized protein LOC133382242 isoform X1 [Rhineura floridana]XP_061477907.1 uncharacterized protein LOC133382242 isoform X1 [Rhineura floridana]XP_061477909.1 uncharacterized protein LOC133382242 isoform X1 [Rhineura floridana]XP_061477910.1 uncharacterized protein LOC133382242 isoform X1 [Rhineura floridana]XP_061477911.1 uncharacterized protein LOC133382242 isoform X1 [Rhineura floridana]